MINILSTSKLTFSFTFTPCSFLVSRTSSFFPFFFFNFTILSGRLLAVGKFSSKKFSTVVPSSRHSLVCVQGLNITCYVWRLIVRQSKYL